jgi:hypothetical protein
MDIYPSKEFFDFKELLEQEIGPTFWYILKNGLIESYKIRYTFCPDFVEALQKEPLILGPKDLPDSRIYSYLFSSKNIASKHCTIHGVERKFWIHYKAQEDFVPYTITGQMRFAF